MADVIEIQKKTPPTPAVEIGRVGLKRDHTGHIREEWKPNLRGRRGAETYNEMLTHPIVGGMMFAITMVLREVDWTVEADDTDRPQDKEAAEFLTTCMKDMETTWEDFIAEALAAIPYGWAYFEKIFKRRRGILPGAEGSSSKYDDGRWGWRKFAPRAQDSLEHWVYADGTDDLLGLVQRPQPTYQQFFIPIEKALHFRMSPTKDNPEGQPLLRRVYRPWFFVKRIEELESIGIDRDLAGMPLMRVPAEIISDESLADMRRSYETIVRNLRRDESEGVLLPSTRDSNGNYLYDLQLLTTGGSRQFPTNESIQRYNHEIAMTALADFMMLGQSKQGSFALSVNKTDFFSLAFSAVLDSMAAVITKAGLQLLRMNGMTGHASFKASRPGNVDIEKFTKSLVNLAASGIPLTDESGDLQRHILETVGLPSDGVQGMPPLTPGEMADAAEAFGEPALDEQVGEVTEEPVNEPAAVDPELPSDD